MNNDGKIDLEEFINKGMPILNLYGVKITDA